MGIMTTFKKPTPESPDIPIILCTGFSHTINAEKAQAQGIDAFLMKPLVARQLGLAIQQVLEQRAAGQG